MDRSIASQDNFDFFTPWPRVAPGRDHEPVARGRAATCGSPRRSSAPGWKCDTPDGGKQLLLFRSQVRPQEESLRLPVCSTEAELQKMAAGLNKSRKT